jgi:hypothetical protein
MPARAQLELSLRARSADRERPHASLATDYMSVHSATDLLSGLLARAVSSARSLPNTTTRGPASASRDAHHNSVLDRDVDAIGVELRGHDRAWSLASNQAKVASGSSGQFPCVVQAKPDELTADSMGVLETCLQMLEAAR